MDDKWDKLLKQQDAYLITWLHNKTDRIHNIFLPYSPNQDFIIYSSNIFRQLIEPAISRIKNYLIKKGIEDVNEYMRDSQEWMFLLFDTSQYHFSADLVAEYLNLEIDRFPMMLIWTDIYQKDLILIYPNKDDRDMTEYVKSLYWCIITGTKSVNRRRSDIRELKNEIEKKFTESYHIKDYQEKVEQITIIQSHNTIANSLREIGNEYKEYFYAAILNFEEYIEESHNEKNIINLCNKSKNDILSLLEQSGFQKLREGGNHEVWKHPNLQKPTPVPRHNKLSPFVLSSIQKDIQLAVL